MFLVLALMLGMVPGGGGTVPGWVVFGEQAASRKAPKRASSWGEVNLFCIKVRMCNFAREGKTSTQDWHLQTGFFYFSAKFR